MRPKFLIFILIALATKAIGQDLPQDSISTLSSQPRTDQAIPSPKDTIKDGIPPFASKQEVNSKTKKEKTFKGPISMFAGNPGRAALYSLLVPGGGQFYNKKYWKIPLVLAAEGAAISVLVNNIKIYNRWDKAFMDSIANIPNPFSEGRSTSEILDVRNSARKNRDYAIVGVVIVHIIQVADAFVHRHLIEFDVSDDLSLDIGLPSQNLGVGLTVTF